MFKSLKQTGNLSFVSFSKDIDTTPQHKYAIKHTANLAFAYKVL